VGTRNLVFNHLSVRIHDEDSNWPNHHNYVSGGSVWVEDKYASRDVTRRCVRSVAAGSILLSGVMSSCVLVLNNCIRALHIGVVK
jgi:hypothetical protein